MKFKEKVYLLIILGLLYSIWGLSNPIAVIDLGADNSSSIIISQTITDIGVGVDYYTSIPQDIFKYESVFLCLGMFDDQHILKNYEGILFDAYLNIGGKLYIEGGDTWAYDYPTPVHNKFGIIGLLDGLNDLDSIQGDSLSIMSGIKFKYVGNNFWVDRIKADSTATNIFFNTLPFYGVGVIKNGITYQTIGTSFEFGGVESQHRKEVMLTYLKFFGFNSLYGQTYYDNTIKTPLDSLYVGNGTKSVLSDSNGWYQLYPVFNGQYSIVATGDIGHAGINGVDALLALRYFVGLDSLNDFAVRAADVNGSGGVNATDALAIAQRFAGTISSFSVGDMISDTIIFTMTNDTIIHRDIKILNTGDVNRDRFIPKKKSKYDINTTDIPIKDNNTIDITILSKEHLYSMYLKLLVRGEYSGLSIINKNASYFVENIVGDTIYIISFDVHPMKYPGITLAFDDIFSDIDVDIIDCDFIGEDYNVFDGVINKERIQYNDIKIYPNPVMKNQKVWINFGDEMYSGDMLVFDNTGKIVYNECIVRSNEISITANFSSGIYYIVLDKTYKLIVK